MATAEVIVICIDNSKAMLYSHNYSAQLEAIKHYCKAKLDANPENEVVLFSMGSAKLCLLLHPSTSDLQKILDCLKRINRSPARLQFQTSVRLAKTGFSGSCPKKQRRMLFFAGGFTDLDRIKADKYGKRLKELGIAVDVVNFYLGGNPERIRGANIYGRMELDVFFNAANCNDNSHIEHIEDGSTVCQVLSKSMLKETLRLSWKKNQATRKKNEAPAPAPAADNKHVPNLMRMMVQRGKNEAAAADVPNLNRFGILKTALQIAHTRVVSFDDVREFLTGIDPSVEEEVEQVNEIAKLCSTIKKAAYVEPTFDFDLLAAEKLLTTGIEKTALQIAYPEDFLSQKLEDFLKSQEDIQRKLNNFFVEEEGTDNKKVENKSQRLNVMKRRAIFFMESLQEMLEKWKQSKKPIQVKEKTQTQSRGQRRRKAQSLKKAAEAEKATPK